MNWNQNNQLFIIAILIMNIANNINILPSCNVSINKGHVLLLEKTAAPLVQDKQITLL